MIIGNLLVVSEPKLVIETGVFNGLTTKFVCEFLKKNGIQGFRIAAFDMPDVVQDIQSRNPYFASEKHVELVGGLLPRSLQRYLESTADLVDFAIVDGDHSYKGVTGDLETLAPRMRPGGYIFAHDYRRHDPEYRGLTAAVYHFAVRRGFALLPLNPTGLPSREVWGSVLLRKPEGDRLSLSRH